GVAMSVFLVEAFFRFGLVFDAPVGVKLTFIFSPGTLVSQSLSPTFFARSETAGSAAGGFGLGAGGVRSPIIMVTPMYPQVVTAVMRPACVSDPDVIVKLLPVIVSVVSCGG